MKIESTGSSDYKRIVDEDGEIVGFASRYTGGNWAAHEADTDKALTKSIFTSPARVRAWFEKQKHQRK